MFKYKFKNLLFTLIFGLNALWGTDGLASMMLNLKMANDTFAKAQVFESPGDEALLWIPSEYGNNNHFHLIAEKASKLGLEIWIVDLFAVNYLTPSASSFIDIPISQVSEVLTQMIKYSRKRVWLMSSEKTSRLVLEGMKDWQNKNPNNKNLGGAILLNPDLTYGVPPVGENPVYVPIVHNVTKPVFILQSRLSENYWYLNEMTQQLKSGGAKVKTLVIPKVRARFQVRRYTETIEDEIRDKKLPFLISYAIETLLPLTKNPSKSIATTNKKTPARTPPTLQTPLDLSPQTQIKALKNFSLLDLKNKTWNAHELKGNVKLISFWATWCASCRYLLKIQQKFYQQTNRANFEFLSVSFNGKKKEIRSLVKRYNVTFPILFGDERAIKAFNLRKFPTHLIVDKKNLVRYAFYGIWNDQMIPEIQKIIEKLKKEP